MNPDQQIRAYLEKLSEKQSIQIDEIMRADNRMELIRQEQIKLMDQRINSSEREKLLNKEIEEIRSQLQTQVQTESATYRELQKKIVELKKTTTALRTELQASRTLSSEWTNYRLMNEAIDKLKGAEDALKRSPLRELHSFYVYMPRDYRFRGQRPKNSPFRKDLRQLAKNRKAGYLQYENRLIQTLLIQQTVDTAEQRQQIKARRSEVKKLEARLKQLKTDKAQQLAEWNQLVGPSTDRARLGSSPETNLAQVFNQEIAVLEQELAERQVRIEQTQAAAEGKVNAMERELQNLQKQLETGELSFSERFKLTQILMPGSRHH